MNQGMLWPGVVLISAALAVELALSIREQRRPEREPLLDTLRGVYRAEEAGRFVGGQAVDVPAHWLRLIKEGQTLRLRIARPPGEAVAFVLAIEGVASADDDHRRGITAAPVAPPFSAVLLAASALIVAAGVTIGVGVFGLGDTALRDGWGITSAVTTGELHATSAEVQSHGHPAEGILVISDATVLPRNLVSNGPTAAWVVLSPAGRERLVAEREAKHGRKLGGIPTPGERTTPVELQPEDVLAWRIADLHEDIPDTGRPGDQVMVWLARQRPFAAVATPATSEGRVLLGRRRSEEVATAIGFMVAGLAALPVFILTLVSTLGRRSAQARFDKRVQTAYGNA